MIRLTVGELPPGPGRGARGTRRQLSDRQPNHPNHPNHPSDHPTCISSLCSTVPEPEVRFLSQFPLVSPSLGLSSSRDDGMILAQIIPV